MDAFILQSTLFFNAVADCVGVVGWVAVFQTSDFVGSGLAAVAVVVADLAYSAVVDSGFAAAVDD